MKQRLWTRNFTLLILGQICSLIGNNNLKFALSMYVLEQTGSAAAFAGMLAAAMLPTILLSPFGGILADRANRRSIMVALDALSGISVLTAGLILPYGHSMAVIRALLVMLSVLGAFESPTVQACVPQMLSGHLLLKGNAAVSQVAAIASLITPFLGSLAYAAFGLRPVLWGTAACFLLTALLECLIRLEYQKPERRMRIRDIIREDFSVSIRFLGREQPAILKLLLLAALVSLFVSGTVVVGFPYLVRTALGLSAEHYGAAESAMGAAAILGSLCVGLLSHRLRLRYLAAVFIAFGLCLLPAGAAFLLPIGTSGRYGLLLAMFCACQFGCSVFSTCAISVIQRRTPEHLMGKIMSCVFTLSLCAQPLGQIVYGALFDLCSGAPSRVLLPSGLLVCIIGLLSARFFVRLDHAGNPTPANRAPNAP